MEEKKKKKQEEKIKKDIAQKKVVINMLFNSRLAQWNGHSANQCSYYVLI